MPDDNIIPGFVPGVVKERNDNPAGLGLIKVFIPEYCDPVSRYWVKPAGWPGAGGVGQGSQYPSPPIGAQVYVMFEQGRWDDPEASAIYLPGMYGLKDGQPVGPQAVFGQPTEEAGRSTACIWEDENFMAYVTNTAEEKKFIIQTKNGSAIEIDANASPGGGNSEMITIEGRTAVSLFSKGLIDIAAGVVQIQGRRIIRGGGDI